MKKILTTFAVASMFATPSLAQSNLSIYGIVDMGYSYRSDHVSSGVGSRSAIDSGMMSESRLGFRGTEDLGRGYKIGFVLEAGLRADTGTSADPQRAFGRQSFVRLDSRLGTLALGRQYSPAHLLGLATDPFAKGTVGQMQNIYTLGREVRLDNLLSYTSPSWQGFTVVVGHTLNAIGDESAGNEGRTASAYDYRVLALSPQYRNGPLLAALSMHEITQESSAAPGSGSKIKVFDLFATYDLGVAKLAAAVGRRDADKGAGDYLFDADVERTDQWMLGATIPLDGVQKVLVSYARRDARLLAGGGDASSSRWALGYQYGLSKRTTLYAAYADVRNDDRARAFAAATVSDNSNAGGGYQSGLNLGVRHTF